MWYFKIVLWLWHLIGIFNLFIYRGKGLAVEFWGSAGLVILTAGFLGIIKAVEGGGNAQDQTSEVGEIKEI